MTEHKKPGRKAFSPTDEQRKTVRAMSAYGIPQEDICSVIGVSGKTLRKHFATELETAEAEANAKVAQALYQQAIQGHVGAQCFWLKTRARWKETHAHEVTGKDGGPVETDGTLRVEFVRPDSDPAS